MNGKKRTKEQSRQLLWQSFLRLLTQKDYSHVTVKEIAANASLDRGAFYRSFANKGDLIDWYCQQAFYEYLQVILAEDFQNLTTEQFLGNLLNFWWDKRETIKVLIQQNLTYHFLKIWNNKFADIYDNFKLPNHIQGTQTEIQYLQTFTSGGFYFVIITWLDKENPDPPSYLVQCFTRAYNQILEN